MEGYRKYTIYAVDFDGTLCESKQFGIGEPNIDLINHLIKKQKEGNKIILWTCREGQHLQDAIEWCKQYGLYFDAVNDNLEEMKEFIGHNTRKIRYDVLIDDKAKLKPKYNVQYKSHCIRETDGNKVVFLSHSCACGHTKGFTRRGEICPKCGTPCLCISVSNDKDDKYYDEYYGRTNDFTYAYAKSYLDYIKIQEEDIDESIPIEINIEELQYD